MIHVPAMYPFPAVNFPDKDLEALRVLASALESIHEFGTTYSLCGQVYDWEKSVSDLFCKAISDALSGFSYLTGWACHFHGLDWEDAARCRPAYALHIAQHIREQIGE